MPNDVKLETWKERIRGGQRFMSRFAQSNDWNRFKNYYRHKGFRDGIIPVNIMFSILRSMVPQVYFRNPTVSLTPRRPGMEAELNARILQKLDNWLLNELYVKREIKKMVQDNFFCGIGAGLHGYDSEYGYSFSQLQNREFTLSQFDKAGNKTEFNETINPGMPWFLRARPEDVVFPWGATDKESLEWFAFRVFRSVDDIKADKKYENTSDLTGDLNKRRTYPEGASGIDINDEYQIVAEDVQWAELWQCHDVRTGKVYALTMQHNKFLRNEPDGLQIEGLPLDTVVFNPDPDYIYGVPDARIIEPQLLELNDIRTQSMKHRRINILKALVREDAITEEEIQKLTSEDVQGFIRVKSDTIDLGNIVLPLNPGVSGILSDLIAQGEVARGDIREMVGFSRTATGEFQGKTHISATETEKVFQALNIRLDERRDQIADLVESIVRRMNQLIFTHWSQDRVSSIIGPDGAKYWVRFNGQQIKEEYDISVTASEGAPMTREAKKQFAVDAARAWAELNQGAIQQGQPIPAEIQRLIFNQFEDTGLDIDKLLAQSGVLSQQTMMTNQAGSSPENPAMVGQLAQMGG